MHLIIYFKPINTSEKVNFSAKFREKEPVAIKINLSVGIQIILFLKSEPGLIQLSVLSLKKHTI